MKPVIEEHDVTVYQGDVRDVLAQLPAGSVQCCVTSPPYYALRDYGVDGQIGLEPSPAEYVETMRAVFAEVRRVLAADGVLWLNLGDSYSGSSGFADGAATMASSTLGGTRQQAQLARPSARRDKAPVAAARTAVTGLPPKNLLGIPWMVARALQQPQYVGKITSEADRAWLAALIDGEGCIAIHRRAAGSSQYRKNDTYAPMVQVSNTNLPLLERAKAIAGVGSISHSDRGRNRRIYRWCVMSNDARQLLREVYPHLIAKEVQARIAYGTPSSGVDASLAWQNLKLTNQGLGTNSQFGPPPSMFDSGWILRNAIVWSKPNAMPESVTDRLSTRYEHVFLFSKSRRYRFDVDPIREAYQQSSDERRRYVVRAHQPDSYTDVTRGVLRDERAAGRDGNPLGRNPGDVWTIATSPFPGAHFATMPPALVKRCILAGCPEDGTVLDPFTGSGTTAMVARQLGRRFVGAELNPSYIDIIRDRIGQTPLDFGEAAS